MSTQPNPMKGMTVVLEDNGQDFLEFDIKNAAIADARPCQADIWSGLQVLNEEISIGDYIALRADWGTRTLLYPVVEVRSLDMPIAIGPTDV